MYYSSVYMIVLLFGVVQSLGVVWTIRLIDFSIGEIRTPDRSVNELQIRVVDISRWH